MNKNKKYTEEELHTITSYKDLENKHPFIYKKIIEERTRQLKISDSINEYELHTYPTDMIASLSGGGFLFDGCGSEEESDMWSDFLGALEDDNDYTNYNKVYEYFGTTYEKERLDPKTIKNRFAQLKF